MSIFFHLEKTSVSIIVVHGSHFPRVARVNISLKSNIQFKYRQNNTLLIEYGQKMFLICLGRI